MRDLICVQTVSLACLESYYGGSKPPPYNGGITRAVIDGRGDPSPTVLAARDGEFSRGEAAI